MKIPVDLMAVFQEAMDVDAARSVPITVSVLLDEVAPADLVAFVRSRFASASSQARVSINYFSDASAVFDPKSDMAVIAAGVTPDVGLIAQRVREAGIPALVVTTLPEVVAATAYEAGHAIPEGDLVAPQIAEGDLITFPEPVVVSSEAVYEEPAIPGWQPDDPSSLEPYSLDARLSAQLARRMGEWVVACFHAKRLAFAQAFEFMRRPLSMEAVRFTSMQNAGVGLVAFIPGADLPIMTLNQAKMVLQIAAAYGQPLTLERAKELACVVGGGFACRAAARQLVGVIPALGWAIKAAVGYTGTSAMGHAAIEYFERGGNAAGVVAVAAQARATAARAMEKTAAGRAARAAAQELGRQAASTAKDALRSAVRSAPSQIARVAQSAAQVAARSTSQVARSAAKAADSASSGVQAADKRVR